MESPQAKQEQYDNTITERICFYFYLGQEKNAFM